MFWIEFFLIMSCTFAGALGEFLFKIVQKIVTRVGIKRFRSQLLFAAILLTVGMIAGPVARLSILHFWENAGVAEIIRHLIYIARGFAFGFIFVKLFEEYNNKKDSK